MQPGLLIMALLLWGIALPAVDADNLTDFGILTILPLPIWLSYAIVVVAFVVSLRPSVVHGWLPFLALAALVLLLHLTPAISYETLRYSWAWKHIGIVDFIQRNHSIDPQAKFLAVYHNWPGFFAFFAALDGLLKMGPLGVAEVARYFPTALNLLFLAVVPTIFRRLTNDERLVWSAAAIFLVGNWVGQDYFSPQGTAYLFYLGLVALVLGPLARPTNAAALGNVPVIGQARRAILWLSRDLPPVRPTSNVIWLLSAAAGGAIISAITVTHQLTPLLAIGMLSALAILGRLPISYLVFAVATETLWLFYFADPFVSGTLADIVAQMGSVNADTLSKMANFDALSPGQRWVSLASRGLTAAVAGMALVGGLRRLLRGTVDTVAIMLTLVPVPLLFTTSYGGEIIFRLYFYALPFLAFFAGAAFYPSGQKSKSWWINAILCVACLGLILGFLLANNGKDRQYRFSRAEVAAADWLYSNASKQSLLVEGSRNYPSQFRNYEYFNYVPISEESAETQEQILADPVNVLGRWLGEAPSGGYVIVTRSQIAGIEDLGLMPKGAMASIVAKLTASARFDLVYSNRDAKVFRLDGAAASFGTWVN